MNNWRELAHNLAENVLLPAANTVDAEGKIPPSHFEALASEGLYGITAPPELGGPDVSLADLTELMETLFGGCLATTFTWGQHLGLVGFLASATNTVLRETYWERLLDGSVKGSISMAGALPEPPLLHARRTDGGYILDGLAPFVSGWGIIDVLLVFARDASDDTVVQALIDAHPSQGASVEALPLIAARASNTVQIRFENFPVADDRVSAVITRDEFMAKEDHRSRVNASMPMGIARRCLTELEKRWVDTTGFAAQLSTVRNHLDATLSGQFDRYTARAEALELVLRAAAALVAVTGSSASVSGNTAERLMREATLALVTWSRPQIRDALVHRLRSPA